MPLIIICLIVYDLKILRYVSIYTYFILDFVYFKNHLHLINQSSTSCFLLSSAFAWLYFIMYHEITSLCITKWNFPIGIRIRLFWRPAGEYQKQAKLRKLDGLLAFLPLLPVYLVPVIYKFIFLRLPQGLPRLRSHRVFVNIRNIKRKSLWYKYLLSRTGNKETYYVLIILFT